MLSPETLVLTPRSQIVLFRSFYSPQECLQLCQKLSTEIPWIDDKVFVHGRWHTQSRRTYACGEPGLTHRYSGVVRPLHQWIPEAEAINRHLRQTFRVPFNACLFNEYKDGSSSIGFHSDKEIDPCWSEVVSVSLGGSRDFKIKSKHDQSVNLTVKLENGDCLAMLGSTQEEFIHSVPKRAQADYRISLTYRVLRRD